MNEAHQRLDEISVLLSVALVAELDGYSHVAFAEVFCFPS